MLEAPLPHDIMSKVVHYLFIMQLTVQDKEMVPIASEHGLKVESLRKRAGKVRKYTTKLEQYYDKIVDDIDTKIVDDQDNQQLPKEELDWDVEEGKKVELYHNEILGTTIKQWGEAEIQPHPRCGSQQKDMAVQCLVIPSKHNNKITIVS
jgi:hypothetical protein